MFEIVAKIFKNERFFADLGDFELKNIIPDPNFTPKGSSFENLAKKLRKLYTKFRYLIFYLHSFLPSFSSVFLSLYFSQKKFLGLEIYERENRINPHNYRDGKFGNK